jgi:hypothetical protein
MSTFRLLSDHVLPSGAYVLAGTVVSTADVGGTLPIGWISNAADPLDVSGVQAFYALGPQITPLVRQQWVGVPVSPPVTYWRQIPGGRMWGLTGLGSALPPIGM